MNEARSAAASRTAGIPSARIPSAGAFRRTKAPWLDRRGRFSWLKAAVFAALFVPALMLVWRASAGTLGPRPITEILHQLGLWAVRLIVVGLAVTPLRTVWRWPE